MTNFVWTLVITASTASAYCNGYANASCRKIRNSQRTSTDSLFSHGLYRRSNDVRARTTSLRALPAVPFELLLLPSELDTTTAISTATNTVVECITNSVSSSTSGGTIENINSIQISSSSNFGGLIDYSNLKYAFMLPIATLVATCCQLAGIGGAALFSPVFLLVFPLLGPEYTLPSAASAIASALLTECFGFASGLSGFARRELVDWKISLQYMVTSIPSCLLGAVSAKYLASDPTILRIAYASLMLGLAAYLTLAPKPESILEEECDVPDELLTEDGENNSVAVNAVISKTSRDGQTFNYLAPRKGSKRGVGATATGGILTGLLGVGIGEVILPQLVRGCCMPLPVAAGTSVAVVVVTALTAAVVQFWNLAQDVGPDCSILNVVPWELVQFTVPGVLIGGQIAPAVASKGYFSDDAIELFAASLFGIVGIAFALKVVLG
eukprot:CAMPEP_0194359400 /NCGR_PEP_ID=MMETSP0174-20130528/6634_1 /TAXON_ID=216777 /ORGANISM="Proboscia alata, Strain PI-D3" /LENGTH=440 /DNA_ID=CAMNT_0039130269 /DNA_START=72 /DNA_END=1394 /DNA_ORIENTATION=-